ncbi:type II toxin-antitoxin system HipA family toxin YjjJ [Geobacter sp. FeAm09]|uniref:type II toxin-antitoxin system HipA family toxin YjjJ n=1 Tax=Geobacter sp. FeAm09 TaxID=2597769 RepID=UPI00143D7AFB|nr:type II toxin-antitoxin system HipA family toxin YjjJ [Geobacter sp. FeAm09]
MATDHLENTLLSVLYDRPLPARRLRQLLGNISPATLSRLTRHASGKVVTFGQARSTTYARPRDVRGLGYRFPVFMVDAEGNGDKIGELLSLHGGYRWEGIGEWASELYPHLPWFIQDMRPDGFVGRAFAQRFGPDLGLPDRLTAWRDDDTLVALSRRGEDIVGDLIVGDESITRYVRSVTTIVPVEVTAYPGLANAALAGSPPGSSAGGEQPKFSALVKRGDSCQHVLVKFSPLVSTPQGQRWSDLLVCEHIALGILERFGIPAVSSAIHQVGGRTFLEVDRFDRVGLYGRSPVASLTVVDAEFTAMGHSWTAAARALFSARRLTEAAANDMSLLDFFGDLIANTDRHFGNVSLIPIGEGRTKFRLAPAYDMLPMYYRPRDGEELNWGAYNSVTPGAWPEMRDAAKAFWREASGDPRISGPFQATCRANLEQLSLFDGAPRIIRRS